MLAAPPVGAGVPRHRVGYVLSLHPAVSQTFIADEIESLASSGIEVRAISINTPREFDTLSERDRRMAEETLYIKSVPKLSTLWLALRTIIRHPRVLRLVITGGGFDLRAYLWRAFYLVEAIVAHRECRRLGIRHVHAHFGLTPSTIAWFTAEVGRTCDGEPWSWSLTIHGWHEFVDERAALLREKLASATFVACVSDYTRSQMMRIGRPADWGKLRVVRCGIDLERMAFAPRPPVTGLGTSPPIEVLQVARLAPEKGHLVLLEACALLRSRGRAVRATLVGPGELGYEESVHEAVERLGLHDVVDFAGPLPPADVDRRLARADVFCLPTFAEGLPISIMEAMAIGVPVVTTYISGIPELAIDGTTAMVVPAARPDLVADAIERIAEDPAHRDLMLRAARTEVEAHHDARHTIRPLVVLLGEAVAGSADRR